METVLVAIAISLVLSAPCFVAIIFCTIMEYLEKASYKNYM